jgi:hypothetical protein
MCYRSLNDIEVKILQSNNCWTKNWSHIQVKEGFDPNKLYNVEFYGDIKLGRFEHEISVNGIMKDSCIKNSSLHNCVVEDNVYINRVTNISNYHIKNCVIIEDAGNIIVNKSSSFGNGIEIEVLNEGGGRDLPIFENLNAQLAYMIINYQHDQKLVKKLKDMIAKFVESRVSEVGIIGKQTLIQQVKHIENVNIGAFSKICSTDVISNGTILSSLQNHTIVKNATLLKNVIMQEGSKVENDAQVENCFIGQSVTIGKQYSAENSAFFANSEFFHGEACSLFAGPYTVTHHKSSLLIAGLFSFYNAGSGTNQSNHMYKLGPVHQGILERGCKTGSFSYLLWPGKVGPFSAVMGKHYSHFDVSDFPFSYVEEHAGESILSPAMNLITVGTVRDSQKWPKRDKRKGLNKRDLINFDLFSPFIIAKVIRAQKKITELYENASKSLEFVNIGGIKIKRLLLRTAKKYYKIPINIFLGEQLIKYIESNDIHKKSDFLKNAYETKMSVHEKWVDLIGMIAPYHFIDNLIKDIKTGNINDVNEIFGELTNIHNKYDKYSWQWTIDLLEKHLGKKSSDFETDDYLQIINTWKTDKIKLNNMILRDADKEFDVNSMKGYGLDGDEDVQKLDFENVRGTKESNSFVKGLLEENKKTEEIAERMRVFFS